MNWYYALGQEQKGPVTDEQLRGLVSDGVITGDTLVWREGLANWQAYRTLVPPVPTPPTAAPEVVATVPVAALGNIGTEPSRVVSEESFFQTDYAVSIGHAWSRGWRAFTEHAGVMIGGGLLLFLVACVGGVIPFVSLIITGPLTGGLYWLYLKCVRGQEPRVADGFAGFGPQFLQLMLANIVPGLLAMLPLIPGGVVLLVGGITGAAARRGDMQALGGWIAAVGGVLLLIGLLVTFYFTLSWSMTLLLVVDKRLDFWRAMSYSRRRVGQHLFYVFFFFVVSSLISVLGVLALGVGLFVTVPVAIAMVVGLYETMFRDFNPVPHGA